MNLVIRLLINAAALWVAAYFIPGIMLEGDFIQILIVAAVFGLINALLKPIVKLFSLPFLLLTLGLFALVINAAMLGLTAYLTEALSVSGFWAAVLGSIVISIVSALLNRFVDDDDDDERNRRKNRRN